MSHHAPAIRKGLSEAITLNEKQGKSTKNVFNHGGLISAPLKVATACHTETQPLKSQTNRP